MKCVAVLLAAGRSSRFGRDKMGATWQGEPLWLSSYRTLNSHPGVDGVGVVCSDGLLPAVQASAPDALFAVVGGNTRQESAYLGLQQVPEWADFVLIHDAARAFVTHDVVGAVLEGALAHGAAYPAVPVTDTVRELHEGGWRTLDRDKLVAVQTPQAGRRLDLLRAHDAARGQSLTDDVAVLEHVGIRAERVEGRVENVKVTYPEDLPNRPFLQEVRTGFGYDIHAFSTDPDRPLYLGGVLLDERPGLEGHSDADVLAHAVVDAILGAAALGDIGEHFPPGDPQWRDCRSTVFLEHAARIARAAGWTIMGVDACVIAERPKLSPRRDEVRRTLAEHLSLQTEQVGVKATTNERLGSLGRAEGIAAHAVATLIRTTGG